MKKTILSLLACVLVLCATFAKADEVLSYTTNAQSLNLDGSTNTSNFTIDIAKPEELPITAIIKNVFVNVEISFVSAFTVLSWNGTGFVPNTVNYGSEPFSGYVSPVSIMMSSDFGFIDPGKKYVNFGELEVFGDPKDQKWKTANVEDSFVFDSIKVDVDATTLNGKVISGGFSETSVVIPSGYNVGLTLQYTGSYTITYEYETTIGETVNPEPATLAIMGLGLAGAGFAARRRIKK